MTQAKDRRLLVWVIVASHVAPPFMIAGVAVALPTLGADLGAGATSLGLVETLFLASQLAFLLPTGRLAAAGNKESLFKLGLLGFAVSSILISLLSSMPIILALRFVQGASAAVFSATGPAILADIVPANERGKAYGRSIGAVYVGLTLGPMGAGALTDLWGWRAVFLAGGAVLLAMYLLVRFMMPSSWRRPPAKTVHLPSAGLVVGAAVCLVAGSATIRDGLTGYGYLAGGLALIIAFILLQKRVPQPLVNIGLLIRNHTLAHALLVQLLLYTNAFAVSFVLSIYMQVSLGYSANISGQILAVGTVLMAITAPVAGSLADRYRPRRISGFGVGCVLVSAVLGIMLGEGSSLSFVILILVAQGLGFALFSSPNMAIIMNSVPAPATSIASALGAMSRSLGMFTGMLVTGGLISLAVGHEPIDQHPLEFIAVVRTTFSILAAMTAAILVIFYLAGKRPAGSGG